MGSSVAVSLWRDVVGKRWVRCAVWQGVISTVLWLLSEFFLNRISRPFGGPTEGSYPFLWTGVRFTLFQVSQGFFLLGQTFVLEPEERDGASLGDLVNGFFRIAVRAVVGRPRDESAKSGMSELRNKIITTSDHVLFATMCASSGFLAFISLLSWMQMSSGTTSLLETGSRGAALGLLYAALQFYQKNVTLAFPLIERGLFFALKMGIPSAVSSSLKLAAALLPLGEALSLTILSSESTGRAIGERRSSLFQRQFLYAIGNFAVLLSWQLGRHIVVVLQTKQHVFAPPLGSAAADVDSTELLLTVLEDPETCTLVRYHAFHDLCMVSETNVDTWRRAAFFEETGDTYRRLIDACLKRLDTLTFGLAQHLEGFEVGKDVEFFKQEMQSVLAESRPLVFQAGNLKNQFRDFQLCAWCARTVAALTACSRFEDRYGVAQLHGCNVDVVSSLLSCLLIVEVYLGRRSHASGAGFVPNSIKWTVPSTGAFMDAGKRQGLLFGKRSVLHTKAYAMADVLRTSIYQIVSVFGDEMVQSGSSAAGFSIAERDWLSRKKPLFGAREIHIQKLKMFVEFCIG